MRLEDSSATIRSVFPTEYVDLAVFVTDLGGSTVLMFLLATLFWLTDRRRALLVVSYAFAGVAFILAVKALLGMPRPPEAVFLIALDGDEYGFPSGHAFAAVVVYGGLVSAFDRTQDWPLVSAVVTLVVLIALSRVVLGLHYLGDVIVGALLGLGYLLAMGRLTRGDPRRGFAIGVILSIPTLAVAGIIPEVVLALGGSIGGVLLAGRVDTLPALRSRLEGVVVFASGCAFVVAILAVESVLLSTIGFVTPVSVVLYAVLVAGIIATPEVVRLDLENIIRYQ